MKWYYASNGGRQGPVSDDDLAKLVASSVVTDDTLVWKNGMANWQRYGDVKGSPTPGADSAVCAMSGKVYPKSEMIEHEGRWVSAEHRDAYFARLREGVSLPGQLRYVGFWRRFGAKFIDGIIVGVVNQIVNFLIFVPMIAAGAQANPGNVGAMLAIQGLSIVVNLTFGFLYAWFFLSRFEATPGKLALGIKVVRADGSKLSTGRILGRYFAEMLSSLILCIGYLMVAFDKEEHKALHDQICDTRVVYK